ncbi:hypothetical protein L3X38_030321 [Prunus dulcis]|uniref:Bulb-type lectin domain-containing protein n=1 Tax=Prunus dulcis TaxID=3755 RepID=A0AAD4YTW3_PRUDU|nr:hypothetical protein L3X38_030321 [Prunus dulcis]
MTFDVLFLLYFILFMFVPCSTTAQTYRNISLGSSLTALNDDNSSRRSPSGEFAFGFQQIGKDGFLLAIWFNKITEKTIVWSANEDNLVPQGSKVELTADGPFLLNDISTGKDRSIASSAATGVAYAAMLDTGNFVHSTILWGSFDQPTDTILPAQTLNNGSRLFANKLLKSYWKTDTNGSGFQVIFNHSGSIYLAARNGTILNVISSYTLSKQDLYQRATLDYDGVLRQFVCHKGTGSNAGVWSTLSFILSNICMSILQP